MDTESQQPPIIGDHIGKIPYVLSVGESIRTAFGLMQVHDVRHLPVMDGQKIVGLVSDRDVLAALAIVESEDFSDETPIESISTKDPYCVEFDTALDKVLDEMADRHIGSALVLRSGELAGIFTTSDVCRVCAELLRGSS